MNKTRRLLLTDSVTIQGASSRIVAPQNEWLDLGEFQDVAFWIDTRDPSPASIATHKPARSKRKATRRR